MNEEIRTCTSAEEKNAKSVIFFADGGVGKTIMGTVPLRGIKEKYPDKKIIVVSSHPEVFKFNPNVYRVFQHEGISNFYDDYVARGKAIVFKSEPYYHNAYLHKKKHLTELWCDQLNLPFDNVKPDLFFTDKEIRDAKNFVRLKNAPILLIQFQGGAPPQMNKTTNRMETPKMFVRNLPPTIVENVISEMKEKYTPLILKMPTQNPIKKYDSLFLPLRQSLALVGQAHKLLLIDSMLQHAAAAQNKQAVVCWAATSPKQLGYESHINLRMNACSTPECHRPNSFLVDVDCNKQPWECPHGEACTRHDEGEIIKALKQSR